MRGALRGGADTQERVAATGLLGRRGAEPSPCCLPLTAAAQAVLLYAGADMQSVEVRVGNSVDPTANPVCTGNKSLLTRQGFIAVCDTIREVQPRGRGGARSSRAAVPGWALKRRSEQGAIPLVGGQGKCGGRVLPTL